MDGLHRKSRKLGASARAGPATHPRGQQPKIRERLMAVSGLTCRISVLPLGEADSR
jgi:hypothetical protein